MRYIQLQNTPSRWPLLSQIYVVSLVSLTRTAAAPAFASTFAPGSTRFPNITSIYSQSEPPVCRTSKFSNFTSCCTNEYDDNNNTMASQSCILSELSDSLFVHNDEDSHTQTISSIDETPTPTFNKRKRGGKTRNQELWEHSRRPIKGVEPERNSAGRAIWYCKHEGPECSEYSVVSSTGIRHHMKSVHRVVISEAPTSTHKKAKQQNLVDCFGKQKIKSDQELALERREILRVAADTEQIKQNALRLVVQHDLPLALPTYVTMNSLIYSANPMAARALWESPTTTANHIRRTFRFRRTQLSEALQRSLTKIHITTDTWRSPNKHELQAVTAHWLRPDGKVVKALLGLPEMLAACSRPRRGQGCYGGD